MNKIFEVLVYTHEAKDGVYGCPDQENGFDTYDDAKTFYDNVRFYHGKELMKYASLESDADGDVLEQDHPEDADLSERSFSVTKIDVLATCEVNFDESELVELNGLTQKEIEERVREAAINSDMWRIVESEENVSYEVDES